MRSSKRARGAGLSMDPGVMLAPAVPTIATLPRYKYLNMSIVNANSSTTQAVPVQATFTETRQTAIIDDPSRYEISVVRFNANGLGTLLPLFIPTILTGQTDPNLTIYTVQMVNAGGGSGFIPITYVTSQPGSSPVAQAPLYKQDISSTYYYVRTFTAFAAMINSALLVAATACGEGATPPYLTYQPVAGSGTAGLFQMHYPATVLAGTTKIRFNGPLQSLFTGFNWLNTTNGVFELVVPTTSTALVCSQDFSSTDTGLWSPIDSFVFCTAQIPCVPEDGTVPVIVGSGNVGGGLTGGGFQTILTDFALSASGAQDNLNAITFAPQIYRMTSLISSSPLQVVDVSVFWRSRLTGELVPIYLPLNSSISLKLMFRRRDDQPASLDA